MKLATPHRPKMREPQYRTLKLHSRVPWGSSIFLCLAAFSLGLGLSFSTISHAASLELNLRQRTPSADDPRTSEVRNSTASWEAERTAIIVCDMWDRHWCPDATERVGEMVPRMNEVLHAARAKGVFIIHCPSDTLDFYRDHPARKRALAAPKVETAVPIGGWCALDGVKEPPLPIDDSDEGCDGCPDCPPHRAWSRQHPGLDILDTDAITDNAEAYYLMRQRGITNVIVMGVHANMCVLGRPFSIRQMVYLGQNVVLMRDLTDAMYNHRQRPYVSHFRGTELVVEHIEKYWCPSITSTDLVGGQPFRFKEDIKKHVVLVTGENEYDTGATLPEFARRELEWRGYRISHVAASPVAGTSDFKNSEVIKDADLVILSVRRRTPPKSMLDALRKHVDSGKPLIGLRTASHAFDATPANANEAAWPGFDREILGMTYEGHYSNKPPKDPPTVVRTANAAKDHPVLTGVPLEIHSTSHLYKNRNSAEGVTILSVGHVEGRPEREPVHWVNETDGRRVFYTSLGNPADFESPSFKRLLLNGVLWCLRDFIPPITDEEKQVQTQSRPRPEPTPTPAPQVLATPPPTTTPTQAPTPAATPQRSIPPLPIVSTDTPQQANAPAQDPQTAANQFIVADDLVWEQILSEPIIEQPVFLNFDERGRMWVVEYRQYPHPAGLNLVSRDSVWRAVYDKVPTAPPNHVPGRDRISIHEDTNGDGQFDKHSVFVDGLNIVTSVERGRGGVWVLNPPYLLFYPDVNNDDIPDGPPEVRLSGFGLEDTHSVVNSLRWGPDGWLYGAQGSTVTGNVMVYGSDDQPLNQKPIYSQGQNIWRYHPERRIYEVFSEGGGNAFGCEFDNQGRVFSGHNGGDTRGFHYFQGAYLQKGFEKHGPLSNPYAYGYFPPMPHPSVHRFTHTFVMYEGGAFPEHYNGHLFGVEPLQGRIVLSERIPDKSSFRTRDLGHPIIAQDRWFRPVDIKIGPDGALYVCDWYDQQVNHYRNHEGEYDPERGRIYRLRSKAARPRPLLDLSPLSPKALADHLNHPNKTIRQTALRLLADRRDKGIGSLLANRLPNIKDQIALETLWAAHLSGADTTPLILAGLSHSDPFVRQWAVRLHGDSPSASTASSTSSSPSPSASKAIDNALIQLASEESHLEVRNQLAATARRLPADPAMQIVRNLLSHTSDADDNRMPLLLWWTLETHCSASPEAVLNLFKDSSTWDLPTVERHLLERLARRFAQSGTRRDFQACATLFELAPTPAHSRRLLAGFETAIRGRSLSTLPDRLVQAMARHGMASVAWGIRQQDPDVLNKVLQIVQDTTEPRARRIEYLSFLSEVAAPEALPVLIRTFRSAAGDNSMRRAALNALQIHEDPAVADAVIGLYPKLSGEALSAAQHLLASRPVWARKFVDQIASKDSSTGPAISADSVPAEVVLKFKNYPDPDLREKLTQIWPRIGVPPDGNMEEQIARWTKVVEEGKGDPYHGRTLFQQQCAGCHKLFTQGASVGPDLTAFDRSQLANMLLAIVHPNAEIREGYEAVMVETHDGRWLSGFVVEQDSGTVVLRGLDANDVVLDRETIANFEKGEMSLMPEGLLDPMSDQDVRDLFAYLRSTQPLVGSAPPR